MVSGVAGGVAYLFPGQGAQQPGMGREFYDAVPETRALYQQASRELGYDVAALCFEGPAEQLKRTDICQPAIFVTSMAALIALQRLAPQAPQPSAVAGLSLGEFTALAAAGALSFAEGVYLLQVRGEAMAEAAAQQAGSMLALVGAEREPAEALAREAGIQVANLNAPGQIVLSGAVAGIERAEALARTRGFKRAMRLEVSGAFHSSLMEPAGRKLREALERVQLRPPRVRVISNYTGEYQEAPEQIRQNMVGQVSSPVLWEEGMRRLLRDGVHTFLEPAPGKVLSGLLRRIDPAASSCHWETPADLPSLAGLIAAPSAPAQA